MKANYHTHTARCGHAFGTDEEYIKAAIAQGFDELGMSDHVPWPYKSGFVHHGVRMPVTQMDEYVQTMRRFKEKYADQISLRIGFECEYFPEYMDWLAEMKQEKQLDYLIFGCHYDTTDEGGFYFGNVSNAKQLVRYVDSALAGIDTGLFAYLAHPDVFLRRYQRIDENVRAAAKDLSQACKAKNLPMEYNLHDRYRLGEANGNGYPHPEFFDIVFAEGAKLIIGLDAHEPQEIADPTQWNLAMDETARFGERRVDRLNFR